MTASLKFYFNLRPNSTGMNPHKLTPRENTAIWEENWHLLQKRRTFSPVHAGWLSSTEVRYNRSRWTPIDRHSGLDSWIHHHSPCACCASTHLVYGTRLTKGNCFVWQVENHFNCAIFLFTRINIKMLFFSAKDCYCYLNLCCFQNKHLTFSSEKSILFHRGVIFFRRLVGNL